MELLGHTVAGLEEIAKDELEDLTDGDVTVPEDGRVMIDADETAVFHANYRSGTCSRFVYLLNIFTIERPSDAYENIDADFSERIRPDQTFAVRVHRHGDHDFSSVDVAREAGQAVVDQFKDATDEQLSVDLDDPDVVFRCELFGNRAYFGIDTTGTALNERQYFRDVPDDSTPPVLANAMLRYIDYNGSRSLLDPFCGPGIIPIEAGRIACMIPNAGRKFAFIDLPFLDNRDYATVAEETKEQMEIIDLPLEGSDTDISGATMSARASGLDIPFAERDALDRPLDSDIIAFHAPFIEQRSKRSTIADRMEAFEAKLLASDIDQAVCFTEDRDFFSQQDETIEVSFGDVSGWVVIWEFEQDQ